MRITTRKRERELEVPFLKTSNKSEREAASVGRREWSPIETQLRPLLTHV